MNANAYGYEALPIKRNNFQIKNKMSKENKTSDKQQNGNDFIADVSKRLSKLSKESRNKLFAIWMSKERLEGSKTLDLMFALDDEWQRVYDLNRKNGFSAAILLANERLLALIYGC